jgi:hypothetical protein
MKNPRQLAYAGIGLLAISCLFILMNEKQNQTQNNPPIQTKSSSNNNNEGVAAGAASELDRETAKYMATGQVILMASCLGKRGAIPRERMGDYIAAAVEKQGISRSELHEKWDFYWGFAKRAEEREGTSCLE